VRGQKRFDVVVILDTDADLTRAAKGNDFAVHELELAHALEEFEVFRVRAGVARLDITYAQRIELFHDLELVFDRVRNTLSLCAIAQGRVVSVDSGHG